jgi:hypothetical protein
MPSVILKKGRDHRLHAGDCWVYAGEIAKVAGYLMSPITSASTNTTNAYLRL